VRDDGPPTPPRPCTLVIELPSSDAVEIARLLAVLDQIVAQLWSHFGSEVTDLLLRDFRAGHQVPTVRVLEP
jgi:hypothetical protein